MVLTPHPRYAGLHADQILGRLMYDLGSLDAAGRIEIAWKVALAFAHEGGAARGFPPGDPPPRYAGLDPDRLVGRVLYDIGRLDDDARRALSWHVGAAVVRAARAKKRIA